MRRLEIARHKYLGKGDAVSLFEPHHKKGTQMGLLDGLVLLFPAHHAINAVLNPAGGAAYLRLPTYDTGIG